MKSAITIYLCLILLAFITTNKLFAQRNSGIFYSTLYSKEYPVKRIDNFGTNAKYVFLKDVNGDKLNDAIVITRTGTVMVAFSDGMKFQSPKVCLQFNYQTAFVQPLMGDVNGDGKTDLIYFDKVIGVVYVAFAGDSCFKKPITYHLENFSGPVIAVFVADFNADGKGDLIWAVPNDNNTVSWYVAISSGYGFATANLIKDSFGDIGNSFLVGDVNEDGKADLVSFNAKSGSCEVALSDGAKCQAEQEWITSFHPDPSKVTNSQNQIFLLDLDGDKKDDLILWERGGNCNWWVTYSNGINFEGNQLWIRNFLPQSYKNNVAGPDFGMVGFISDTKPAGVVVSLGKWLFIENGSKQLTADPALIDTYEAWGCDYIPDGGTYDSGDQKINDRQIKQIHDAGFTYVTMDITNGSNDWVDSRAKNFMERVRLWNQKLKSGDHKIYVNISLGLTREVEGEDNFFTKLNLECKRAWEEFYLPYKDLYYKLNAKPLVIHMINTGWDYAGKINTWKGDRFYIDKFTNRWMDGIQTGADKDKPNTYGWIVPGINTFDKEMMPLMPGFWNGLTWYDRNEGETYRNQWLRVFQYKPASVWVNSFNETWEHTSVEPSFHVIDQFVANPLFTKPWTDYYGDRYDSYYWDMTKQYNKLFMNNVLYVDTYFEEFNDLSKIIYKVTDKGFVKQKEIPRMSPVLLLPWNFHKYFSGQILRDSIK